MEITSSAYKPGGAIPAKFTCDRQNISPEFSWNGAPKETKSFALVVHDPDAPRKSGFAHWVLFNIPSAVTHVSENMPRQGVIEGIGVQGKNDSGKIGYAGPCPPSGTHRYFARVYALRDKLDLQPGATYEELVAALDGKVIEEAELMGTYARASEKVA